MSDSYEHTRAVLKKWVNEYLAWLRQSGFAPSTIYIQKCVFGHFERFADERSLGFRELFTYERLLDFEKHCGLCWHASWSLRSLAKYLARAGAISSAIEKPAPGLPDIYEEHLNFYRKNEQVVPSTLATRRMILIGFHDYLSAKGVALSGLRIEHIDEFLRQYNKGRPPGTCRQYRSHLRGFLQYLYQSKDILGRDLSKLVIGAVEFAYSKPPKYLRGEEIKRLFSLPRTYSPWELRCFAMVGLAYSLGLRPKEISRLRLDDIFFQKGQIRITERKSNNPVILPLPEMATKAIAAYLVGGRPKTESRYLFITLKVPLRPLSAYRAGQDIATFLRKVNPRATAYWLRHTYAQNLLESQASIFEVKEMMGHDTLRSTRRYLHIHTRLMRKVLFNESV